jgi:hypothetical protein
MQPAAGKHKGLSLEKGKKVFDAKLYGACKALELAQEMETTEPVTVLLDSQSAIIQHTEPGPGRELALRAQNVARELAACGREPTVQ